MLIGGLRRGGRCMNIALLGGSGVGKTNYICTLFREIRNLSNRYRTNISYQDPDGTVEKYRTINDKLDASYNGGVAPYFATEHQTLLCWTLISVLQMKKNNNAYVFFHMIMQVNIQMTLCEKRMLRMCFLIVIYYFVF